MYSRQFLLYLQQLGLPVNSTHRIDLSFWIRVLADFKIKVKSDNWKFPRIFAKLNIIPKIIMINGESNSIEHI